MSKMQHHKSGSAASRWNSFPRGTGNVRFGGEAKVIRFPGHYFAAQASAGSLSGEPTSGANIIEFHQRGHLADRQIAPQTALEVLADSNEYAVRMVENGIAGAAILALIAAGYWSLSTLVMLS